MTPLEISAVIGSGDNVCAQIQRRPDGSIMTKVPSQKVFWLSRIATLAAALFAMITLSGCQNQPEANGALRAPTTSDIEPMRGEVIVQPEMGEVCVPEVELGDVAIGPQEL